jgi:predicted transcriptional regulator of viral defense system
MKFTQFGISGSLPTTFSESHVHFPVRDFSPPSPSAFFSAMPIFRRDEFAAAFGRQTADRAITDLLKYHLRAGNIRRVARGVFASVPAAQTVDRFLAASRLRIGAVIAYRSALELHGYAPAPTAMNEVQVIAPGEPGLFETVDFACRFVSPPIHHSPSEGLATTNRQGLPVSVTTLERTLVDLFDRYDLAGGAGDLFLFLDTVVEQEEPLNIEALVDFARHLNNASAAAALGYWLDRERNRFGVKSAAVLDLHSLAPRHPRYALGATPGRGLAATGWNVILPADIIERYYDD